MNGDLATFSKVHNAKYGDDDETEFFFQKIELGNKIVLNVQINGAMDTTFDIPMSSRQAITLNNTLGNEEDTGVEPIILVGDYQNLKIQVVASQIGKLVLQSQNPKNVILSIGSKWFGKGDTTNDDDFDKLMFILGNVKSLLS